MDRYGFHRDFVEYNKFRLKHLYESLHSTYNLKFELYNKILYNKPLLEYIGINFKAIDRMAEEDTYVKWVLNPHIIDKLPSDLVSTIYSFININTSRLPNLKKEIKIVAFLIDIPERAYFTLQYSFNKEVANSVIRGGVYSFGQKLSRICISFVKRTADSKPCIDWGESNKLKRRLIEKGLIPKNRENPNGISWILYHTNDGYCFWKWTKSKAFVTNKRLYKFRSIATNNECTDYGGKFSLDEILEKRIGTFDRMMATIKFNPNIKEKYHFNFLNF